jgi:hypothetical protein
MKRLWNGCSGDCHVLIIDNLDLEPEVTTLRLTSTGSSERSNSEPLFLFAKYRLFSHYNAASARSLGADAAVGWTSPFEYVTLDANATYLDFRNTSSEGPYSPFKGDCIAHRPCFLANASGRLGLYCAARAPKGPRASTPTGSQP